MKTRKLGKDGLEVSAVGLGCVGEVVASGVWTAGSVRSTRYAEQAYQLGKSI